jgi:hypothetical protein
MFHVVDSIPHQLINEKKQKYTLKACTRRKKAGKGQASQNSQDGGKK